MQSELEARALTWTRCPARSAKKKLLTGWTPGGGIPFFGLTWNGQIGISQFWAKTPPNPQGGAG